MDVRHICYDEMMERTDTNGDGEFDQQSWKLARVQATSLVVEFCHRCRTAAPITSSSAPSASPHRTSVHPRSPRSYMDAKPVATSAASSTRRTVLLLDDTMEYRSMRKHIYQLCRQCKIVMLKVLSALLYHNPTHCLCACFQFRWPIYNVA